MAKRTFNYSGGGKFVPIERDADDESKVWRAADRLGSRSGEVEIVIERTDGTYRNLGSIDWDTFDDLDDLYDWIDDVIDGDGDGGYYGEWSGAASVVSR